jgi:hypothetical protein
VAAGLLELYWAAWKHHHLVRILSAKHSNPESPYCQN